jgi:hypothetical protein
VSTIKHNRSGSVARHGYAADPWSEGRSGVRQVPVPRAARELSTLSHIDYADAYTVALEGAHDRSAEQWARAIFDDMPIVQRLQCWSVWTMVLGLRLALPTSSRHILGWELRANTADHMLLGARSAIGMPAELLVKRCERSLLFDTFVQKSNPLARAVWAGIQPTHERVLPRLLTQFRRRIDRQESRAEV